VFDVALADLIAQGNLGLLRALAKLELERAVRFGAYAWRPDSWCAAEEGARRQGGPIITAESSA